jgi:hypothetical protein
MTLKLGKPTRMWAAIKDDNQVSVRGFYPHLSTHRRYARDPYDSPVERVLVTVERIPTRKKGGK